MSTFGELQLRSTSPPPLDNHDDSTNDEPSQNQLTLDDHHLTGFSTIDLNGTHPSSSSASMSMMSSATRGNVSGGASGGRVNGADLSYTSFERETAAGNSFSNPTPPIYNHPQQYHHSTAIKSNHGSPSSSSSPITNGMLSPSMSSSSSASMSGSSSLPPSNLMSTAGEVSSRLASKTANTLEHIRLWSKSAYKCTKQIVSEKLGKSARTVDPDIENAIEVVIDLFWRNL